MYDLSWLGWGLLLLCGFLIGMSKTGIPGIGILAIPIMAWILPPRASVGVVLPMLMFADLFAVAYYRRNAVWSHLVRIMPWAFAGIVLGHYTMDKIDDEHFSLLLGAIVLAMLLVQWIRTGRAEGDSSVPTHWWFAALMGLAAGFSTMVANAAGPIMALYLLAMHLPKKKFVGTRAWYFLVMNWVKVPFYTDLDLINVDSLRLNLLGAPAIVGGAFAGIVLLRYIPQKFFTAMVFVLAAAAAAVLILRTFL